MKKIYFLFCLLFIANCSFSWGSYKKYSVEKPANLEEVGPRVTGSDCTYVFRPAGWFANNLGDAIRDAISKAPGATGLADIFVTGKAYKYFFVSCIEVEGTPVKEKTVEVKTPKKK